ncbi:DUF2933 domain-containing protein [Aquabacterium sp.]|uniref:DUF2933 domain-containing protein n=1 Tax=Aquabacterium sp. TaxID=1872578 RepID=UPI002487671B|nr:DUF2933 domain-containing protein [Aquabacterium sp.]MDI1261121.1 DUF2933 domain-containing protein [Aquabacterium sp.]
MDHQHDHGNGTTGPKRSFFKSPVGVAAAMLALIAVFYVLREHWQHVAGGWPYLLLLACPLMHVFHGHGGHGGRHHGPSASKPGDQP